MESACVNSKVPATELTTVSISRRTQSLIARVLNFGIDFQKRGNSMINPTRCSKNTMEAEGIVLVSVVLKSASNAQSAAANIIKKGPVFFMS